MKIIKIRDYYKCLNNYIYDWVDDNLAYLNIYETWKYDSDRITIFTTLSDVDDSKNKYIRLFK